MYQVLTNITVQQVVDYTPPNQPLTATSTIKRDKIFTFNFLSSYECESGWENLTQTMKIVLPKNVKLTDQNGNIYTLSNFTSTDSSIGGYVGNPTTDTTPAIPGLNVALTPTPTNITVPTFMRGDMITLNVGYRGYVNGGETTYIIGGADPTGVYPFNSPSTSPGLIPNLFQGFITKVSPRMPFTLECEDAMYLLSLVPTPNKHWKTGTLQDIVTTMLNSAYAPNGDGSDTLLTKYSKLSTNPITIGVSKFSTTDLVFNVQSLITTRGDLRGFIGRIAHQYSIHSYFRGNELRIGPSYYVPDDAKAQTFTFQQNILDGDSLHFKRKDDIPLSVIVTTYYSVTDKDHPENKDGSPKTKAASTSVLVYNQGGQFVAITKQKSVEFPANDVGKRFTLKRYTPETNVEVLKKWGIRFLKKYYYDGLAGSFTTFGVPYVKHGDIINIANGVLPEMNGMYMCKSVSYHGGAEEGLRQTIELDFKINTFSDISTFLY